jgi:type VI secretion system secreted protein VgrG
VLDRSVRGELALIALRLMRELGVRHGVPFKNLEARPEWALPEELRPIAEQILEQTLAGNEVRLGPAEECLLRSRYIHQSAHWTPRAGLLISKPAPNKQRNIHPNQPQKGYPQ